jgi:hypothetical protein
MVFNCQPIGSTFHQSLLLPLETILGIDMSECSVKIIKPGYVIASTSEAYMASLALSSYEFLEVWPDKASQRLPIS